MPLKDDFEISKDKVDLFINDVIVDTIITRLKSEAGIDFENGEFLGYNLSEDQTGCILDNYEFEIMFSRKRCGEQTGIRVTMNFNGDYSKEAEDKMLKAKEIFFNIYGLEKPANV
jgi:hypothetical protein